MRALVARLAMLEYVSKWRPMGILFTDDEILSNGGFEEVRVACRSV